MNGPDTLLTVARIIQMPPATLWSAWTSPEELGGWWWPARFQTTYQVDLRVAGAYLFRTSDVPGMGVLSLTGRFEIVDPPRHLVYTWCWEGSDEPESRVRVQFRNLDGATEIQIRHEGLPTVEARDNHITGWNDCLDRLEQRYRRNEANA